MVRHSDKRWERVRNECKSSAEREGFDAWSDFGPKLNPYAEGKSNGMPLAFNAWQRGWDRAQELSDWELTHD